MKSSILTVFILGVALCGWSQNEHPAEKKYGSSTYQKLSQDQPQILDFWEFADTQAFYVTELIEDKMSGTANMETLVISNVDQMKFSDLNLSITNKYQYFLISGETKLLVVKPMHTIVDSYNLAKTGKK